MSDSIELLTPDEYDREIARATINWRYPPQDLGVRVVTGLHYDRQGERMLCSIAYEDGFVRTISCVYPTR